MKQKPTQSETDETLALIDTTVDLIRPIRFDFLILHTKSGLVVSTESEKFIVTMRLARKKGVKKNK